MKILKLFMVTLLLAQITGCVSVERPAEKEKEKIIVVPEKDSDRNYWSIQKIHRAVYVQANRVSWYFIIDPARKYYDSRHSGPDPGSSKPIQPKPIMARFVLFARRINK